VVLELGAAQVAGLGQRRVVAQLVGVGGEHGVDALAQQRAHAAEPVLGERCLLARHGAGHRLHGAARRGPVGRAASSEPRQAATG
jgi:hypothetical protein